MVHVAPRRAAALLVSALALGACSDDATAPDGPRSVRFEQVAAVRVPNSIKYAENGRKPATGRSGTARLEVRALLSRHGSTLLEVTTGSLRDTANAPGTMSHVQVKLFASDGKLISVGNYFPGDSYFALSLPGLVRGDSVQVQANVRGIDGHRTDVVTVIVPVLRRPDLQAAALMMPDTVVAGLPVAIGATVSELNGDVGAWADCILYVAGDSVDAAPGIWVDAGDAVSCAFSHTFAAPPGDRAITVAVENVDPYDDDPSNNAVSGTLFVTVEIPNAFDWTASARDETIVTRDSAYARLTGLSGTSAERWNGTVDSTRAQSADFDGTTAHAVQFPLRSLELAQRTGGATAHRVRLIDVAATSTSLTATCAGGDLQEGIAFSVCSSASPAVTTVAYRRRAGRVTYHSLTYGRDWYRDDSGTPYYVENTSAVDDASASGAPLVPYGSDYRFLVRLDDHGWIYIQEATVPLAPFERVVESRPWSCRDDSFAGIGLYQCASHLQRAIGSEGAATGTALVP